MHQYRSKEDANHEISVCTSLSMFDLFARNSRLPLIVHDTVTAAAYPRGSICTQHLGRIR